MESELLPCPFCGESAREISENHMFAIQCMTCECKTDYFHSYKKASDIWNTRTNKDAHVLAELKEWLEEENKTSNLVSIDSLLDRINGVSEENRIAKWKELQGE